MSRLIVIFIGLIFSFNAAALSKVTASVSQNPVSLNESVDLILTVDDKTDSNIFDFNKLSSDFRVLGTSVSSETRMINFDTTRVTRFTTRLMPKKTGNLTIPSFSYQGISSDPIVLSVTQNQNSDQNQKDIFVETELSQNTVWLQQQVTYTTRLYLSVQIASGSLTQPEVAGAVIEQQGKDKEYDKIIDGVAYRVVERSYKIVPQRSGEYTIDSPLFQAEVLDSSRSQFGFNRATKTISRIGDSQKLEVKAIPNNYVGHWLPSELVMLHDEYEPNKAEYLVGEPITRVITLSALDVSEEQLPEIKPNYPDSIKVYPDQAEKHSNLRDNQYVSQRIETAALIPSQIGEITLPAVELTWWDTKHEKMQTARLEAKTIKVVANPNMNTQVVNTPVISTDNKVQQSDPQTQASQAQECEPAPEINTPEDNNKWQLTYTSYLFAGLWLITLMLLVFVCLIKTKTQSKTQSNTTENQSEKLAWSRLLKACEKNNINQIQQYLPLWVSAICQTQLSNCYQAITQLNNETIKRQIEQMQASRFSEKSSSWQADKLAAELKKIRQDKLIHQKDQALSSLNP